MDMLYPTLTGLGMVLFCVGFILGTNNTYPFHCPESFLRIGMLLQETTRQLETLNCKRRKNKNFHVLVTVVRVMDEHHQLHIKMYSSKPIYVIRLCISAQVCKGASYTNDDENKHIRKALIRLESRRLLQLPVHLGVYPFAEEISLKLELQDQVPSLCVQRNCYKECLE